MRRVEPGETTSVGARANVVFDQQIVDQVRDRDPCEFVAINVDSGDFEVDADEVAAIDRLRQRSAGDLFLRRVGSPVAHAFGSHTSSSTGR